MNTPALTTRLRARTKWLALLSFVGAGLSFYLTYLHFVPEASTICQLGELFDCDVVNKSQYSEILGIPVSILGAGYYIAMFIFSALFSWKNDLFKGVDLHDLFRGAFVVTAAGIAFSLYLTYVEAFVLYAFCIFCVVQQIIILIMGWLLWQAYRLSSRS